MKPFDLEAVIKARMRLGSCQRRLDEVFGLSFPSLEKVKAAGFLNKYKTWDHKQKESFIEELGGYTNRYQTRNYLNKLLQESNKQTNRTDK